MLHDHARTGLVWGGVCDGCLAPVWPHIEGTKDDARAELVARGWALITGGMLRCPACVKRAAAPIVRNSRGVRRR